MAASGPRTSLISTCHDTLSIKNLSLPHGVIAPDVWGKPKEQPALLSISLLLHNPLGTPDTNDKLDSTTIHYGTLAKNIRSASFQKQTAGDLGANVENAITTLAKGEGGGFAVARSTVEVNLPKASMFGEGITLINVTRYDGSGKTIGFERVFSVTGVKVMTLIGVNGYERSQKQPLVASIVLRLAAEAQTEDSGQTVGLFNLEQMLVQIIQDTSFETLETLADFTVTQLRKKMLDSVLPGTRVQLRIEKPRAIAFADAPAVEVVRDVPFTKDGSSKRTTRVASSLPGKARESVRESTPGLEVSPVTGRLNIIKPYYTG